jgi:hypothetical protein
VPLSCSRYTITGTFNPGNDQNTSETLTVEVVEAEFNDDPILGVGTLLVWDNSLIPDNVSIEVDQGVWLEPVSLLDGGTRFNLTTQNSGVSYVLARLHENGPILSRATVTGLTVASNGATAVDVLTVYSDGSRLVGTPIMLNEITPDTRVVIEIFVNGVTFEDGTIQKILTAADFDKYGRAYVKFLYPADLGTSFCHRIHVYNGDTYLGQF